MRMHAFHSLIETKMAQSTKPFNARGSKVKRCLACRVAMDYCICTYQPVASDNVAALLLVSDNEVLKPSNTGRLIADVVDDCHVYQWHRSEPNERMLSVLSDERYFPVVVFPQEYVENPSRLFETAATEIKHAEKKQGLSDCSSNMFGDKQPLLIFLDGSWREARRMFRKSPYLDGFPVLSIEPEVVSEYVMRKSEKGNHLATAEVASLVLKEIGLEKESTTLSMWFAAFRESYMLTKTRLKPNLQRPLLRHFEEKCPDGELLSTPLDPTE
ncbi:DTW domain-containing protein [Vibrio profundum]|uniref:tRNA-uridine aminocarboxypropyltransferase n=1 Tax=Vibrio profundum TaxID=2910247 RepID=UPI003D0F7B76